MQEFYDQQAKIHAKASAERAEQAKVTREREARELSDRLAQNHTKVINRWKDCVSLSSAQGLPFRDIKCYIGSVEPEERTLSELSSGSLGPNGPPISVTYECYSSKGPVWKRELQKDCYLVFTEKCKKNFPA